MTKAAQELHALEDDDLLRLLKEAQTDLINVRFGLATLETQNTSRLKESRRQIARIRTILHLRELEG
jgi:large subunit ribosomal protein L29